MSDLNIPKTPKAGEEHVSAVVPAEGRFYANPDNTLVSFMPYPAPQVQVTFLGIRVRYKVQTILINSATPEGMIEGNAPQYHGEAEATDLGSARFSPLAAFDLGLALLKHSRDHVDPEVIAQKLAEAGMGPAIPNG